MKESVIEALFAGGCTSVSIVSGFGHDALMTGLWAGAAVVLALLSIASAIREVKK